ADFIAMAPPFFVYFGVAMDTPDTLELAWRQCGAYRDLLQINSTSTSAGEGGAWEHIIRGVNPDLGIWSTGNGWVVLGMARVLATILHWDRTAKDPQWEEAVGELYAWIGEILGVAMQAQNTEESSGLLRNYWNTPEGEEVWFGEVSGSAAVAAVVFRIAVLQHEPGSFLKETVVTPEMLRWAEGLHTAVGKHVDSEGIASPAVDPLSWGSRTPYMKGSPEGQSFVVMAYAAWRDCVGAGVCGV
ncbi:uncharacterized protein MYCGRDRAFT_37591, partial [Zymoseptoria tritici IPO323]